MCLLSNMAILDIHLSFWGEKPGDFFGCKASTRFFVGSGTPSQGTGPSSPAEGTSYVFMEASES